MTTQNWHTEFNPQKFLSRVSLEQLIERNEAYNESSISDSKSPCTLCGIIHARGILLNDKSFLCQPCFSELVSCVISRRISKAAALTSRDFVFFPVSQLHDR